MPSAIDALPQPALRESERTGFAWFLYGVFALSGAVGLIYETIWSRYLGLFVGHSAYAQVIVLVIFLGGMSLGALLIGRRSDTIVRPLLGYAIVEVLVGVIGLVFDPIFVLTTNAAYDSIFPALGGGALTLMARWTLAALLILPQSVLLGMTFPLMSAGALRWLRTSPSSSGRVLSLLYFTNSLGAAAGGLLSGFVLIPLVGLPGTLLVAALGNLVIAGLVNVVVRTRGGIESLADQGPTGHEGGEGTTSPDAASVLDETAIARLSRVLLWVAAGTAFASFVYEIAWIRMLSLVLGGATHSFEIMLSAFILGLALGAFWVRTRADRFADPARALGVTQIVMGVLAVATLPLYLQSFQWTSVLLSALSPTNAGYGLFTVSKYAIALVVMLPATFCAGITLPLITRMLLVAGSGERAIGTVYAVNTLGSIFGASIAGLVLMPLLGVKALLILGALVDIGFGIWLLSGTAWAPSPKRRSFLPLAASALATVAIVALSARFDKLLLISGVFRHGHIQNKSELMYYADGRTATVSVVENADGVSISTNGKPDASLENAWRQPLDAKAPRIALANDQASQILLPLISLAYVPAGEHMAVIGQGSGISSHTLLGSDAVKDLTTIEIEPRMIEGSRLFAPANRRVFEDPRGVFVIDDAKSVFASSGRTYDLILSEPSNPWVSGVSGLFTDEFYRRIRSSLSDRGVFGQWIHLYESSDPLILSVLAAVHRNFGSYEFYAPTSGDMLIVAGKAEALPLPDWSIAQRGGIGQDLSRVHALRAADFDAAWLAGRSVLAPALATFREVNSDFHPFLDLGTEKARFVRASARGFGGLSLDRFSIVYAMLGRRQDFGISRVAAIETPRVSSLALGVRARAVVFPPAEGTAQDLTDPLLAKAAFDARALRALMATGNPPGDWHQWFKSMAEIEALLHGGTSGVADIAFYDEVEAYTTRAQAPAGARAAVRFMRALSVWNWPDAEKQLEILVELSRKGDAWIAPALLRSGGVVCLLKLGRVTDARNLFNEMGAHSQESANDLASVLLDSWIRVGEASAHRP